MFVKWNIALTLTEGKISNIHERHTHDFFKMQF